MKLDIKRPVIESFGESKEYSYSIGDLGMVFDILRNKLYSNKIMAVCREISCNARDAHRAAGFMNKPIEITLPTAWQPSISIKDKGTGISPDVIENVYVKYAVSTKRNDNVQQGAYGIGSRAPYSYTDSFSIITIVDNIKYTYAAFIDETNIGKLSLLNKEETKEENGTEIIVPVKLTDIAEFTRCIEESTRNWNKCANSVRPIIHGGTINYSEFEESLIEGENWAIYDEALNGSNYHYGKHALNIDLIIDGIIYTLDTAPFQNKPFWKDIGNINGTLNIDFPIGVISLAANRESIHLDEKTQNILCKRITEIQKEFLNKIEKKISDSSDYWTACENASQLETSFYNSYYPAVSRFKWNDLELQLQGIPLKKVYYRYKLGSDGVVEKSSCKDYRLKNKGLDPKFKLFVNDFEDCKEISNAAAKKIFEKFPDLKEFVLISDEELKHSFKHYVKYIPYEKISDVLTEPKSIAKRFIFYKFQKNREDFLRTSIESIKEEKGDKVCVLFEKGLYSNEKFPIVHKIKTVVSSIAAIQRLFPKLNIYALDEQSKNGKFDPSLIIKGSKMLDQYLDDNLSVNTNIDLDEVKTAFYFLEYDYKSKINILDDLILLLGDKAVHLQEYKEASVKVGQIIKTYNEISKIVSLISSKEIKDKFKDINNGAEPKNIIKTLNLRSMYNAIIKKYPLIKHVNYYHSSHCVKALADYITLADDRKDSNKLNLDENEEIENEF